MAVKTYLDGQTGRQLMWKGKDQTQGLPDSTNYGNVQFNELTDSDNNTTTVLRALVFISIGAPGKDFWQAPIGSLLIDTDNGVLYIKKVTDATSDASRFDSWSTMDTTVQGGDD